MKNKLPEVGKKYVSQYGGGSFEFTKIKLEDDEYFLGIIKGYSQSWDIKNFWDKFEEVSEEVILIDKIKRIKEGLKNDIKMKDGFFYDGKVDAKLFNSFVKDVENLLAILDEQE